MLQNNKVWQAQLMKHLSHWSWFHILHQYSDKHLVVADSFFVDKLRYARPKPLACKTATPDTYQAALPGKIKKVLVFCQENELAIIWDIQARFPGIAVTSGTYGYALVGVDRKPKLREFQNADAGLSSGKSQKKPVFLISTPYADAEFVSALMVKNDLPGFHEYLARPFATWLQGQKGFQITRFYKTAEQEYSKDGKFHCLIQTDVMNSLFANTNFSFDRFVRYLKQTQAKVILVNRRDKLAQAVRGQMLNRSPERSVWTRKPSKRMIVKYGPKDLGDSVKRQLQINEDEQVLDKIAASGADVMRICLEDLVADQPGNLGAVAAFLGTKLQGDVETIDFDRGYDMATDLLTAPVDYKGHLVDWLGLHSQPLV